MTARRPVGRFESKAPLAVSQVDSTTWETTAPLIFHSATGRIVDVPIGSTTDGASRPRLVAWLISNTTGLPGDVVHDHCYRVLCPAGEITYREADYLLKEMLTALDREAVKTCRRKDRIAAPTRWLMWAAVRLASITTRPGGSKGALRDLGRMCLIGSARAAAFLPRSGRAAVNGGDVGGQHHRHQTQPQGDVVSVTAKIKCTSKQETGVGDNRTTPVTFEPDYQDGRNQKWAFATPHLRLNMTLRGDVADQFEVGKKYTLTFTEETP